MTLLVNVIASRAVGGKLYAAKAASIIMKAGQLNVNHAILITTIVRRQTAQTHMIPRLSSLNRSASSISLVGNFGSCI